MTELETFINELIRSVKQNSGFEDIRFINAYNTNTAEKPVEGYLAVVEMAGIDDNVTLIIRLIGGDDIAGVQLGYTALELAAALKQADTNEKIDRITLSETKYYKSITAFYRDIKIVTTSGSDILGDNAGIAVYLNSDLLQGVLSIKYEELTSGVSLYEFNRGEPYAVINNQKYYEITMDIKTVPPQAFDSGFTLSIQNGTKTITFSDCLVKKLIATVNTRGQLVYTVKIKSDRSVTE